MKRASIAIVVWLIGIASGRPAAFSNLDFENPRTPLTLEEVPTVDALPGWRVYAGGLELNQVWYNNISITGADATLIGPNGVVSNLRIEGEYTSWIYSGIVYSTPPVPGPLSLAQTGLVPPGSRSLQFKSSGDPVFVSLGGSPLGIVPLSSGPNYVLYGADISGLAGQELELRFTAPLDLTTIFPYRSDFRLDSIEFSTTVVPEPTTWALLAVGCAFVSFCWRGRRHRIE